MISAADDVERVEEELDFAWAGSVVDRVGVIRDSVYLAQAPGGSPPPAPHDIEGSSGWTRKPVAPTSALPVVWQAYREANLNGEVNLAWSDWSVPELYAVENDSTFTGFTTQVDLEFRALDLDSSVVATSGDFIEPTYAAPLIEVRQRFRASSTDAFPDWDEAVHRWTAVGRLTPGGVRCGVLAELDTGFACDPDQERTIYRRSVSHLPPANPTGNAAVPPGWYGEERIATSSLPCVYRLTVRAPDCVWPDWSTAGTPVLHDKWTARYFWWITTPEEPVPATPEGFDPFPWMPSRPNLTMPPQCRWVALRAGSPLGGYFWGVAEPDGCRLETTIYMRSASAAIPANPTSTAEAPSGWSIERLCATAVERYAYSLTVVPVNGAWPWADAEPAVLFDEWTETPYWRLTATDAAPPAPTGDEPADWQRPAPAPTIPLPYRWRSTRKGSPCAGYMWTLPVAAPVPVYPAPSEPRNLMAAGGDTQVRLSWERPLENWLSESGQEYWIRYRTAVVGQLPGAWNFIGTGNSGTSATVTGLTNHVRYEFQVAASTLNGGTGAYSNRAYGTPEPCVTSVPRNLMADGEREQVSLSWQAPLWNWQGQLGREYWIRYRTAVIGQLEGQWTEIDTNSDSTSYLVTGLTAGTRYEFQVRAVTTTCTESFYSDSAYGVPLPIVVPLPPVNLTVTPGPRKLTIRWDPPSDDGGAPLEGWRFEWKLPSDDWSDAARSDSRREMQDDPRRDAPSSPLMLIDATGCQIHEVRVAYYNRVGLGRHVYGEGTPEGIWGPWVKVGDGITAAGGQLHTDMASAAAEDPNLAIGTFERGTTSNLWPGAPSQGYFGVFAETSAPFNETRQFCRGIGSSATSVRDTTSDQWIGYSSTNVSLLTDDLNNYGCVDFRFDGPTVNGGSNRPPDTDRVGIVRWVPPTSTTDGEMFWYGAHATQAKLVTWRRTFEV